MSVFIPIPKKDNAEGCSNYRIIALISHASEVMLKVLQARLQQYMKSDTTEATEHKHDYKLRKFIYVCNINGI